MSAPGGITITGTCCHGTYFGSGSAWAIVHLAGVDGAAGKVPHECGEVVLDNGFATWRAGTWTLTAGRRYVRRRGACPPDYEFVHDFVAGEDLPDGLEYVEVRS